MTTIPEDERRGFQMRGQFPGVDEAADEAFTRLLLLFFSTWENHLVNWTYPDIDETQRWDRWAGRAMKGQVPMTDRSRAVQEEGQTRDEAERGAYDSFATYQHLE